MRLSRPLRVGVLGTGQMATAFIAACKSKPEADICIGVRGRAAISTAQYARDNQVLDYFNPGSWLDLDVWVMAVKPNQFNEAIDVLKQVYANSVHPPIIVSLMAGIELVQLKSSFKQSTCVRVMANLSIATAQPLFAVCGTTDYQGSSFMTSLSQVGEVVLLEESQMHAATVVLGSGPALFLLLQEQLMASGLLHGLSDEVSACLAQGAMHGAATLMDHGGLPGEMIKRVASPGGTTEAALSELVDGGFPELCAEAVRVACERSHIIAKEGQFDEDSD